MSPAATIDVSRRRAGRPRLGVADSWAASVVFVVAAGLALRALVAFGPLHALPLVSDASGYAAEAAGMVHGGAANGAYYWPPGTSYLTAGFYHVFGVDPWAAKLGSLLVDAANIGLIVLVAERLLWDRRAALVAGALYALFPSAVLMAAQPFSLQLTMLFLLLLAAFLLEAVKRDSWLLLGAAGAAFGGAVVTRPATASVIVSLLVLLAVVVHRRRSGRVQVRVRTLALGAAAFAAAAFACVFPALHHNAEKGQGWTIATANEQNLWFGNNPYTPNYTTWRLGQHDPAYFPPAVAAYLRRFGAGSPPTRSERAAMLRETKRFVRAHPAVTGFRTLNRTRAFWGFDYTMTTNIRNALAVPRLATAALLALEVGGYVVLMVLFLIGVRFARTRARPGALAFIAVVVAGFELAYALAYAAGRWHFPVIGLLMPFAALGVVWLRSVEGALRLVARDLVFWSLLAVFVALQLEYAYFVWRPG